MTPVVVINFDLLVQRAGKWLRVPRPAELPRDLHLRDLSAIAAFALATYRGEDLLQSYQCCGVWTDSWCEGYYSRATPV